MRHNRHFVDHEFIDIGLSSRKFMDWSFSGCSFRNCDFSKSQLEHCQFDTCTFLSCNISNTKLGRSQFIGTQFTDCKLLGIDWPGASSPIELSFNRSILDYNNFTAENLSGLIIKDCSIREAFFQECNLSHADFTGSDLTDAHFEDCKLVSADFSEVKGFSVNLDRNDLKDVVVSMEGALNLLREYKIIVR